MRVRLPGWWYELLAVALVIATGVLYSLVDHKPRLGPGLSQWIVWHLSDLHTVTVWTWLPMVAVVMLAGVRARWCRWRSKGTVVMRLLPLSWPLWLSGAMLLVWLIVEFWSPGHAILHSEFYREHHYRVISYVAHWLGITFDWVDVRCYLAGALFNQWWISAARTAYIEDGELPDWLQWPARTTI